jgi:NAD dependent epimerase/dehydratase family enzyme
MLARCGLGGRVGHGRQGISWLHIHDMTRLIARAIADEMMAGVYVATAPKPVSQAEFMRELRRAMRMPIALPAAEWMVRFGAHWLLRTDSELVLYGRYCVSRRLEEEGYEFAFENITDAMADLCG